MYLEKSSFDAVITDANGLTIDVDCRVTEPAASGRPAEISIEIPLCNKNMKDLENPCSLRGSAGGADIEIKELWYRSIFPSVTQRRHARGTFEINFAGQLSVSRTPLSGEPGVLRFLLSPVRFLKEHRRAKAVSYSSTPSMTVELFKLQAGDIGEIRFIKFWSVHTVDIDGIAAEIRASFAAEISYDGASPIDPMVAAMKEVLTVLSILTRQAITLHGWIWHSSEHRRIQATWLDPLEPNLAPDMAQQPVTDVCSLEEFETCAQAIVNNFLKASKSTKEAVTSLSVALAPHVERSVAGNFSALFGALEEVIALEKLTKEEKAKLRETDCHLIKALRNQKCLVETELTEYSSAVAARLEGYAKSVGNSGPSFNVRFNNFKASYPSLDTFTSDLWPMQGSETTPGLKQIRDSLAHGLRHKYGHQAIAVAHWHFARLAERLAFLVLGADVPLGIRPDSISLKREQWYAPTEWRTAQTAAMRSI